jgi:hypothetical protein
MEYPSITPSRTPSIAQVSPSALSVEESLSTLDYAHRAKNIRCGVPREYCVSTP